ncbi:augmin complex subunit dgt6-like [Uranotaenia lowii]|uniref:augmin complex subunit dgt6-like n=1 Tax=Uranotaenia lowii TaxID=190385 RepID=UPI002478CEB8|nr:augmin complex subunit dgt6-like [Uranotaenia lowii]XP_055608446.1 augmin complex subunit dgt6-like [Uranotaenia lowii]
MSSKGIPIKRANNAAGAVTGTGTSGIGTAGSGSGSNNSSVSAQEEQLDAAIFYCLNALTKRHPATAEFRAVFLKGMFIKPNTKAFIHVLHFLFNIYDVKEFRKRFYWPIYDKNAESAFRSATVEYVNSLIERGRLELEKIKAHTVVLPGGIKFMKFLLVLIKMVLKEELRRTGGGTGGKILSKNDLNDVVQYHQEWEEIGANMREIVQKDLRIIQNRILEIDDWIEKLLGKCHGPANQMSFEKLMQLWGIINRKHFEDNEARRRRLREVTEEYNRVIVSAKRKLEPKELSLGINEEELKETLYRLEILFPDNACHFREVFDENGKIDAVKLFEILLFVLPQIEQHFGSFSVRSTESLKFELKELSKVAVKSDSICHELASLRRSLPFQDAKFRELTSPDTNEELNNDLGIRNKIFNTPPISLNFLEDGGGTTSKCSRLALLDDDHVHQMNLRMKLLSTSVCHQIPKTPRSSKKPKTPAIQSPVNVFAVPKPARKEKMNPLSMLNKITAQGKTKPKAPAPVTLQVNSTLNISSLSALGEMSLRPEFSSTLLASPEKQSHNRRSINANDTLVVPQQHPQTNLNLTVTNSPSYQSSPRLKAIYNEDIIQKTISNKVTMSPDSLFPLGTRNPDRRRSSLLQLDQLQISPSGKLDPLVNGAPGAGKFYRQQPKIRLSSSLAATVETDGDDPMDAMHGASSPERNDSTDRTLNAQDNSQPLDLSTTLVDMGMSKLSLGGSVADVKSPSIQDAALDRIKIGSPSEITDEVDSQPIPAISNEDLFNVSDGILTDFD